MQRACIQIGYFINIIINAVYYLSIPRSEKSLKLNKKQKKFVYW